MCMKKIIIWCLLCVCLPCAAQKNLLKETLGKGVVKEALGKNAGQNLLQNARVVQGKILLGSNKPSVRTVSNLDRYIFKNVPPSDLDNFYILLYHPSAKQAAEIFALYRQIMSDFQSFKKEMDVFLYYQSKPSERHIISAPERERLMERVTKIQSKLFKLKNLIPPEDPAYQAAKEYILYAAETINPMLRGVFDDRQFVRKDRKYVMEEFFMHSPPTKQPTVWAKWLPNSWQRNTTRRWLTDPLKMAVLNDRQSLLDQMEKRHTADFFPKWELFTYEDTEKLLRDIKSGKHFDVILTDIVVPGGGGYYLTSVLRDRGFNGIILALSAYQEDREMGHCLFDKGFDGMISLPIGFENEVKWPQLIMQKLQSYFYYREHNDWAR